jgi:hypothetical protein
MTRAGYARLSKNRNSSSKRRRKMTVNIRGKAYKTVAERINEFYAGKPDYGVLTELISADDVAVVMKASIIDEDGAVVATGYAEEVRASSNINKTSAVENCETSAVGRALAFYGLAGTEIASADEVANAIKAQANTELLEYNELVRKYWDEISESKNLLKPNWGPNENQSNVTDARAHIKEFIPEDDYKRLWRAPTKGGCWTTEERKILLEKPEEAL